MMEAARVVTLSSPPATAAVGAASERAYKRSDKRERWRAALGVWAAFLSRGPGGANVVEVKSGRGGE